MFNSQPSNHHRLHDLDVAEMTEASPRPTDNKMGGYEKLRSPSPIPTTEAENPGPRHHYSSREYLNFHAPNTEPSSSSLYSHSPYLLGPRLKKTGWRWRRWWKRPCLTRDCWSPSWNMYIFCIMGIGFAIGHHMFYASLDGRIAHGDEQIRMLRYGTALAFAAKASLVASVLTAFHQQIWATMRCKFLGIATLDDMFAAPETPLSLLNLGFLSNAKIAALLALYGWISPLIVILTTNTLIVESTREIQETYCPGVRSLNFSHEESDYYHNPRKINGLNQLSINFWRSTGNDSSAPDFFDFWNSRSHQAEAVLLAGTYSQRPFANLDDTFAVCEKGWNCTAEIKFVGPAYKCQELARGAGAEIRSLRQESGGEARPPFTMDDLAPTGNLTYRAQAHLGEYSEPQISITDLPNLQPPFPKNLGAFRTEPVVWVGYAEMLDSSSLPGEESKGTQENNTHNPPAWEPVLLACEHYEAAYTAELRYIDGVQLHRVTDRKFLTPVVNTTFVPPGMVADAHAQAVDDGTLDNTTATPEENYVLPKDSARYRRIAVYHALGSFFRSMVQGTARMPGTISNVRVLQTGVLNTRTYNANPNVKRHLELFYDRLVLSIFGNPRFLAVVWAADPRIMTGTNDGRDQLYPCTRSRPAIKYYYRTRILAVVYGISVSLALLGVAAGTVALRRNGGVSRNSRFSSILAATRAACLNRVAWDGPERDHACVSSDLVGQKLGYGLLVSDKSHESDGMRHVERRYGFGFEGEVHQEPRS